MNQFASQHPLDSAPAEGQLAIDVLETQDSIIIRSAVAGVEPANLDVNVTEDVVTIRGKREDTRSYNDATTHFAECFWGAFSRSVVLPHAVKPDEAKAVIKNGILTLTIPKARGEMRVKVKEEY